MTLLLVTLLLLTPSEPVKVYVEKQIADHMLEKGFGHYQKDMFGPATPERPSGHHREYLKLSPVDGDVVISIPKDVLARLKTFAEQEGDWQKFYYALSQARPVGIAAPGRPNATAIGCVVDLFDENVVVAVCENGAWQPLPRPSNIQIRRGATFFINETEPQTARRNAVPVKESLRFEIPRHGANRAFIGCVITGVTGDEVIARCETGLQRFPFKPAWRWPSHLATEPGTQFFYEQSGECRVVYAIHDHAVVFNQRKAAINCEP